MPETLLNPITNGEQTQPNVTRLSDGRFVAVWSERPGSGFEDVYAQGLNADGSLSGAPVLINTGTQNTQWEPDIVALPNARYLVVFNDASGGANLGSSILGRIMSPDGTGGAAFKIDQEVVQGVDYTFAASQQHPTVDVFPDGSFVVAWQDFLRTASAPDILARRFDASGTPQGDVVLVSTSEPNDLLPSVTAFPDGRFFVAWRNTNVAGDQDIRGRLFAADGTPAGPDFAVSTTPNIAQINPETERLSDGRVVVVWSTPAEVVGRIMNPNGSWATDEFSVGTGSGGEVRVGVDALPTGGFVVSWGKLVAPFDADTFVRAFDGTGTPISEELQVNATTLGEQASPRVAVGADGKVLVVWSSDDGTTAQAPVQVYANLVTLPINEPVGPVIFQLTPPIGVAENASVGAEVGINAFALDPNAADTVTFSLTANPGELFRIDPATGRIEVGGPIDREALAAGNVTVEVTATSSDGSVASATRSIPIFDVNEFAPTTPVDTDAAANTVAEDAAVGTPVGVTARSTDADATTNAITYSLIDSALGRFAIDPTAGVVTVAGPLDYETAAEHTIIVRALSADGTASSSSFAIAVGDVAEGGGGNTAPVITSAGGGAAADLVVNEGTVLVTPLVATDPDAGQTLTWQIAGGENRTLFTISGEELRFITAPNAESPPRPGATPGYQVVVEVADGAGGTDTQAITVTLGDVNEFAATAPRDVDAAANSVAEDAAVGATVGMTANARDRDATQNAVSYSLTNDAGGRFAIDPLSGVVTVAAALDFESAASHVITVQAASADQSTAARSFTIAVTDVDDGVEGITRVGDDRANLLEGTGRDDTLSGLGGRDTLRGLDGADRLDGGEGTDTIDGGDGDDRILIRDVEASRDVIDGGAGTDQLIVDASGGTAVIESTARITAIEEFFGNGQVVRGTGGANLLDFSAFALVDGVAALQGLGGADTLTGSSGGDVIEGGEGNDLLTGGDGDDRLTGGSGVDTFVYVAGGASGSDTITDFDRSGNDVIRFVGFEFGGATGDQARRDAIATATTFGTTGAEIDLAALGGEGSLKLTDVRFLSFGNSEDFLFA